MSSCFTSIGRRVTVLVGLLLSLGLTCPPVLATTTPTATRQEMTQAIFDTLRTGDWHHALALLQDYNGRFPGEKQMLYNQACLENRAGHAPQALATLRQAIDAGFDEMGFALQDPDLAGVADDPRLFDLDTETRTRLFLLSREKQGTAGYRQWSDPLTLDPVTGGQDGEASPTARVSWQRIGLKVEITTPSPWDDYTSSALPPWAGGPGIILMIAVPDSATAFSGNNTFTFTLGSEKDGPTGAQFLAGPGLWQRIVEMKPKISRDSAGNAHLTAYIPWPAIMPYHPLVDPVLGLNIQIRRDSAHGYAKAVLMPDPWAWAPASARHRFVPITFPSSTVDQDLFMGKITDSIGGTKPVDLTLTALCPSGGKARLTVNVLDPATHPVLPGGSRSENIVLSAGMNTLVRQLDFRGLQTGVYLIRVGLEFPSGQEATWSTSLLQFTQGWQEDLAHRITKVPAREQPTLRKLLAAIAEAVPAHLVRRDPGPISTTVQDLQSMVNQATATGSILPEYGPVTLVYPGPEGDDRLCTLYLVARTDSTTSVLPVLVLQQAGHEGFLVDRIARNHENGHPEPGPSFSGHPVYIVPHFPPGGLSETQAEAEATTCLTWVLDYLGADHALLIGIDGGGGPALKLACREPGRIDRVLIFAGENLAPWPKATATELSAQLSPVPPLPVTWVAFPMETDQHSQGPALLQQMQQSGWHVNASTVPGGLSLTQAADRLVLWTIEGQPPTVK